MKKNKQRPALRSLPATVLLVLAALLFIGTMASCRTHKPGPVPCPHFDRRR